ncbi:iron complex transport system substrate-binding protein [Stella humosa]|uniref:Iron complex transport system substrate-binding protein n=1 Tax=Stella humosa TaxID=94 RepID=A0A3N1LYB5_9PROT|nr:iron complex transport system substrate-binding protein [Stella humosa]BBK30561.1 cobalamin ABC transporter substrate-binding protein [Stella humosa]
MWACVSPSRAAALLLALGWSVAAAAAPTVVSINLCADQLTLALADRAQILALGPLAADPALSVMAPEAAGIPILRGTAEEVMRLRPDLVLSGAFQQRRTNLLLERMGFRVLALPSPDDVAGVAAMIDSVGQALGQGQRGRDLAATFRAIFAPPAASPTMTALVWRPNGFVSGRGTLVDAALAAAGLDNAAALAGIGAWGTMPLERLVARPPGLLVVDDHMAVKSSRAQAVLVHPALARLSPPMRVGAVATATWLCPGPWMRGAVDQLRRLAAAP